MTYNPPKELPPYSVTPPGQPAAFGAPTSPVPAMLATPAPTGASPFSPGGGFTPQDVLESIFQKLGV